MYIIDFFNLGANTSSKLASNQKLTVETKQTHNWRKQQFNSQYDIKCIVDQNGVQSISLNHSTMKDAFDQDIAPTLSHVSLKQA